MTFIATISKIQLEIHGQKIWKAKASRWFATSRGDMLSRDLMGYYWEFRQEAQEARSRLSTFCRSTALHVTRVLTPKHLVSGSLISRSKTS